MKTILYSVYPKTQWKVQLHYGSYNEICDDGVILEGLDSDRNYLPQEVVDYLQKKKSRKWFNPWRNDNNHIMIKVLRDGKWIQHTFWPLNKLSPKCRLPRWSEI